MRVLLRYFMGKTEVDELDRHNQSLFTIHHCSVCGYYNKTPRWYYMLIIHV